MNGPTILACLIHIVSDQLVIQAPTIVVWCWKCKEFFWAHPLQLSLPPGWVVVLDLTWTRVIISRVSLWSHPDVQPHCCHTILVGVLNACLNVIPTIGCKNNLFSITQILKSRLIVYISLASDIPQICLCKVFQGITQLASLHQRRVFCSVPAHV